MTASEEQKKPENRARPTTDELRAFTLANQAMATAAKQRGLQQSPPKQVKPEWRPFQIAFLLMNLRGICEPEHADREVVDLLVDRVQNRPVAVEVWNNMPALED